MDLDVLAETLDQLRDMDPSVLADGESIVTLHRQLAQFDAVVTRATAAFDAAGHWEAEGARTAVAWLRARCRLSGKEARVRGRRGRELRHLPETERAWASGAITGAHVDVMVSLRTEGTGEALDRDEQLLVDQARRLRYHQFVSAVAYWKQLADPDGTDPDAEQRRARRDAYLVSSLNGTWFGQLTLDPVSGAIVAGELERLDQLAFEADWAEARDRLGREPLASDLHRTPGQRRADALVEMATRSKTTPPDGRRPAPLFTVLVGWETLHGRICRLEDGPVLPPGSLRPWLDRADLERAEFRPGPRVAIGATSRISELTTADLERAVFTPITRAEVSPTSRLFTGATRRAIEVRDQECTHPYRDVPAARCQVDHIQPWAAGGPTTQDNGRLLCGPHNRMRNQRPPPDG